MEIHCAFLPHRFWILIDFPSVWQPTDDIVLMALALEKIFLQKVAQMPQQEVELLPQTAKGKGKKTSISGNELQSAAKANIEEFEFHES